MDSESQPQLEITYLRHKIREYARKQRQDTRIHATDALRFGLGQIKTEISELECLNVKDVNGLVSRIKRRKHATSEDMYRLSHAFLQGNDNICAFADKPGAIQVLIKELTGPNLARQIDAAECICNLSLGEIHVCEKIATTVGSYLVTYMDSNEPRLKRSCVWTLANILATSTKAAKILLQMQLVTKLWKLYAAPAEEINSYHNDAGLCLYLLAQHGNALLGIDDCRYIAAHLHEKCATDPASEYYMFVIFQADIISSEPDLCMQHIQHLWQFAWHCFLGCFSTAADKLRLVYGVRVLSNILATYPNTGLKLHISQMQLIEALNKLFALKSDELTVDLMQLLRNLMELQMLDTNLLLEHLRVFAVGQLKLCI